MTASRAEFLKWVGLVSMLIDHAARFLHLALPGWHFWGRFALPCFAVAVAVQVDAARRTAVASRLAVAGVVVLPFQWVGSGAPVVSVLGTFALGLLVAYWLSCELSRRWVYAACALLVSLFAEGGPGGVLLVAGISLCRERGVYDDLSLACASVGAALLVGQGGGPVAFVLLCLGVYALCGGVDVPRVRGLFLRSYFLQWAVVGAGRLLLGR